MLINISNKEPQPFEYNNPRFEKSQIWQIGENIVSINSFIRYCCLSCLDIDMETLFSLNIFYSQL